MYILHFMHNFIHIYATVVSSFLIVTITTLKQRYMYINIHTTAQRVMHIEILFGDSRFNQPAGPTLQQFLYNLQMKVSTFTHPDSTNLFSNSLSIVSITLESVVFYAAASACC